MCSFNIWPTVSNMGFYTPVSSNPFCGVAGACGFILYMHIAELLFVFFFLTAHISLVDSMFFSS